MSKRLHLFQAYGVELEYMIVNKSSMDVSPITDELFKKVEGSYVSDVERGDITWCNELVAHVVELKCTMPIKDLVGLNAQFEENIKNINKELEPFDSQMLPTAAHPTFDPATESKLWAHDNKTVYERYNQMFNCKGHGWSNLQSTHLNLPFYDDEEFARLHAAIRLILPLIPGVAASSPILGGKYSGMLDKRMDYYQRNQKIIPSITGKVIPETVFSKRQYHKIIYDRIANDIASFNKDGILDPVWVNSRGAIARFDRGSIEIRVMDIQECPKADLAILSLIIATLKMLVEEKLSAFHDQKIMEVEPLAELLQSVMKTAEDTEIENPAYLKLFGLETDKVTVNELWKHLLKITAEKHTDLIAPYLDTLNYILENGTLATRIVKAVENVYTPENLKLIYRELADCLANNQLFETCQHEKF